MYDEVKHRRPGYSPGITLPSADGQEWSVSLPTWAAGEEDTDYQAILQAIREAEDVPDRRLAELILGIFLLNQNYRMSPAELRSLLEVEPADSRHDRVAASLRQVAATHLHYHARQSSVASPFPIRSASRRPARPLA